MHEGLYLLASLCFQERVQLVDHDMGNRACEGRHHRTLVHEEGLKRLRSDDEHPPWILQELLLSRLRNIAMPAKHWQVERLAQVGIQSQKCLSEGCDNI